jgi:DNA repair protein RecO (recombination protein O)
MSATANKMTNRSRSYSTDALILRRKDMGEADRLLTLLTPEFGKMRVVAKGVRKVSSKKSGHVELFCLARLLVARGRDLDIVTQAELIESHAALRDDYFRGSTAHYIAELIEQFAQEGNEEGALFELASNAFQWLCDAPNAAWAARYIEMQLLSLTGFRPQLTRCVRTHEPIADLPPTAAIPFSPTEGGILRPDLGALARDAIQVSPQTLAWLRLLQTQTWEQTKGSTPSENTLSQIERALRHYLNFVLERAPKSRLFLRQIEHATSKTYTTDGARNAPHSTITTQE